MDDRECDVFEVYPNHSVKWHGRIRGTECALEKLEELRQVTLNECFAAHIGTLEIIGRVNIGGAAAEILDEK